MAALMIFEKNGNSGFCFEETLTFFENVFAKTSNGNFELTTPENDLSTKKYGFQKSNKYKIYMIIYVFMYQYIC